MTPDKHTPHASLLTDPLDPIRMIGAFAEAAGREKDLPHLGHYILATLSEQLGMPEAAIWVRRIDDRQFFLLSTSGHPAADSLPSILRDDHPLVRSLSDTAHMIQYRKERDSRLDAALAALQAALCLPLRSHRGLLGVCVFGPTTDFHLGQDHIAVTETMGHIASNALDHHLAQDNFRRSSMLMRRTDRLRSLEIMAGGFAHEIRNPLTSIKTFIQLAPQRQHDPLFIKEFSRLAIEDVHRIERLLHEILDYASYMTPQLSEVDLNELVTSCLCFVSARASQRGTRVRTTLAPDLPLVLIDRQQIKQVLLNLFLNALDAMPNGQGVISVQTQLLSYSGDTAWVQLQVEDDGCGIAAEHLEHIFDPFFTSKHSNSAGDGSGLGLTSAHQIVHDHGGQLLVESRVGVGSTFSVNLPASGRRAAASAARE